MNFHIIKSIAKGSIAEELEIEPGDKLISIDGNEIKDVLDYRYYINAEEFTMVIERQMVKSGSLILKMTMKI